MTGDKGTGDVHIDKSHWTGILCLSRDEDNGTDFFRHIKTNSEHAPLDQQDLDRMGLPNYEEFWQQIIQQDGSDETMWEKTFHIPMKFNRLILFRPWYYHNAGISLVRI